MTMTGILERLLQPGMAVLVAGAVIGFGARKWAALLPGVSSGSQRREVIIRCTGLAVAVVGALMVFAFL